MASVLLVIRLLESRGRRLGALSSLLRLLELVIIFAVAVAAGREAHVAALCLAAVASALVLVRGVVGALLTEEARRTLFDRAAEALLAADPLERPASAGPQSESLVYGATFEAIRLCSGIAPQLLGELAAALILTGVVAVEHSILVVAPALLAFASAGALFVLVLRMTRGSDDDEVHALYDVAEGLMSLFRCRLDLIASGHEATFLQNQAERVRIWSRMALRSAGARALGGRIALFGAMLVAAAVALFGSDSWRATGHLGKDTLRIALVLGGSIPAFTSALRDAIDLLRVSRRLAPLTSILQAAPGPRGKDPPAPMPALPAAIRFRGVSFAYPPGGALALDSISFDWKPGRVVVLVGPNGSGKSTILHLLLGLGCPTKGKIEVAGLDLFSLDLRAWRRKIAFVPQRPSFPEGLTLRDVFRLTVPQATEEEVVEALEKVGLWQSLQRSSDRPLAHAASKLSAGECQRLLVARALAASTPMIILDEPDANLDAAGTRLLVDLLRQRASASIAIAAHNAELIGFADELVRLGPSAPDLRLAPASK
jgi:ABC-type transport system involved in cytochrome bd biosynthesis fused ATPase/permease subunit